MVMGMAVGRCVCELVPGVSSKFVCYLNRRSSETQSMLVWGSWTADGAGKGSDRGYRRGCAGGDGRGYGISEGAQCSIEVFLCVES